MTVFIYLIFNFQVNNIKYYLNFRASPHPYEEKTLNYTGYILVLPEFFIFWSEILKYKIRKYRTNTKTKNVLV